MKSSLAAVKRQRFPARASQRVHGLFILGLGACVFHYQSLFWLNFTTQGSFTLAFLLGVFVGRFCRTFSPKVSITSEPSISHFYDCTLGRDVLKNRTFSIFQTASSQGFPLNLPCLNLYLWQKTCTSMAKPPNKNAEQKCQCKRALLYVYTMISVVYK